VQCFNFAARTEKFQTNRKKGVTGKQTRWLEGEERGGRDVRPWRKQESNPEKDAAGRGLNRQQARNAKEGFPVSCLWFAKATCWNGR